MTQTSYQQRNEARLQAAIASIVEHEDVFGKYCTVHSTSEKIGVYSVDIDANLYATSCTCPGNADHGYDCLHMLACDRHFDGRRPNFYEGIRKLDKQVATPVPVETVPTHETEGALPQETRQALANWHQSQAGDAMEAEYNAQAENDGCYRRMMMESEW